MAEMGLDQGIKNVSLVLACVVHPRLGPGNSRTEGLQIRAGWPMLDNDIYQHIPWLPVLPWTGLSSRALGMLRDGGSCLDWYWRRPDASRLVIDCVQRYQRQGEGGRSRQPILLLPLTVPWLVARREVVIYHGNSYRARSTHARTFVCYSSTRSAYRETRWTDSLVLPCVLACGTYACVSDDDAVQGFGQSL